jgi:hypothetical protein
MIRQMNIEIDIDPIIDQVNNLNFNRSLAINYTEGSLLNGPYKTKLEFVGTPLGNALEKIGNLGEARLLKLDSQEGYTAHSDPDDRIHLVISTNEHSYLIDLDEQKMYHLPVDGKVWYMDTSKTHVACNFGATPRIHLNIRVALPKFTKPGYKLTVEGGSYDWKQELYMTLMSFFNVSIKKKIITGFSKVSEREVLINCDQKILQPYLDELNKKGFTTSLTEEI